MNQPRGTPSAIRELTANSSRVFYEKFHQRTQAPSALLKDTDFTYGGLAEFVRRNLPQRGRILDIGCGNGVLSMYIASLGYEVVALDISERAIREAERGAKKLGIKGVTFIPEDFARFNSKDKFDAVLCFDVLEHLPDDRAAIDRIAKLLRLDGKIILRVPSPTSLVHRLRIAMVGYDAFDDSVGHLRRYNTQSITALLHQYGFRTLEIEPVEGPLRNFLYTTHTGNRFLRFVARPKIAPLLTTTDGLALKAFGCSGFNLAAALEIPQASYGV